MGLITLMQYLQKQKENMGLDAAKSSPVDLKGRCLLITYIGFNKQSLYLATQTIFDQMFGLIAALVQQCMGVQEYNIAILGIQQTGKTVSQVLFNTIKHIEGKKEGENGENSSIITYKPTVGLNVLKYKHDKVRFMVWDLGGKPGIRKIWENYYSECHGVIYMLNHSIQEGLQTLKTTLMHQEMAKIPIAVITINQRQKEEIQRQISQLDCLKGRKYNVYAIPLQKMQYMKSNIKQVLRCIYLHIRQLHNQLKE